MDGHDGNRDGINGAWDTETDVVIIGFGGAGASAAIEASESGSDVIILEKAPKQTPGGNTGCCAGFLRVPSTVSGGIEYYRALAYGTVTDEELIINLAKGVKEAVDWLKNLGAPVKLLSKGTLGTFPSLPGAIVDNYCVEGGGHVAFKVLSEHVERLQITVMHETPAKRLIQDPGTGEITGVMAGNGDRELRIKARKGVILACGGYQNNPEMQGAFNYPGLRFYPIGTPYNTGDGIHLASAAGAKLWHMACLELTNFAISAATEYSNCAVPLPYYPVDGSYITVNRYGKRFMPESRRIGHYKGDMEACLFDHDRAEYPNIPPYLIFDETFRKQGPLVPKYRHSVPLQTTGWHAVHNIFHWSEDNIREIESGWIIKADTIEALAHKTGINPDGLTDTIDRYNAFCHQGEDKDFNRTPASMVPVDTPPFYATELCLCVINTQGGPEHNAQSQVLNVEDRPLPRLYAAGELGSFFGHLYQGGSNLPEALAFGRIAGKNAALEKPRV